MNFTEIIKKRFATKNYIDGEKISDADLKEILDASLLAPTALGAEQNRTIVYQEKSARENVSKFFLGTNVQKVETASALVVFVGQKKDYLLRNDAEKLKENMHFFDFSKPELKPILDGTVAWYNNPKSRNESLDLIGAGNKSSYLTLRATELGYDTTIMTGIDFDEYEKYLRDLNQLSEDERVVLAVVIGKADPDSEMNKIISSKKSRMKYEDFVTFVK